ncbi:hypothetical protein AB0B45_32695 [Nonomuraea sp. NPDC049152]|uniref:hypothetical protein n=1 Tax=Nonomuraea sp. NPDC049152 TaxID=3154350 RepID=UPI0033E92A38
MAFLSRLFKRGSGDPLAERDREREEAHRQGSRDAREHPLRHFTDPDCQPAFLFEVRSRARERIARVDQEVAARRTDLLREVSLARETVFRETGRADLYPGVSPNGWAAGGRAFEGGRPGAEGDHAGPGGDPGAGGVGRSATGVGRSAADGGGGTSRDGGRVGGAEEDPFISIAEARWRRAERARREALREASDRIHGARSRIEQLAREWDGMLVERNHEVEAIHAWAQQVIAAYRRGVMGAHPRREEIPSLWKGEVVAMDSVGDGVTAVSSREEIGGLLEEVEHRIEIWHSEVRGVGELPRGRGWRELPPGAPADLPEDEGGERPQVGEHPQGGAAQKDGGGPRDEAGPGPDGDPRGWRENPRDEAERGPGRDPRGWRENPRDEAERGPGRDPRGWSEDPRGSGPESGGGRGDAFRAGEAAGER